MFWQFEQAVTGEGGGGALLISNFNGTLVPQVSLFIIVHCSLVKSLKTPHGTLKKVEPKHNSCVLSFEIPTWIIINNRWFFYPLSLCEETQNEILCS